MGLREEKKEDGERGGPLLGEEKEKERTRDGGEGMGRKTGRFYAYANEFTRQREMW